MTKPLGPVTMPTQPFVDDHDDHDDGAVGSRSQTTRSRLVASTEPGVVFSSLAALCVIDLCDHCTIDITEDAGAKYRIAYPPRVESTGGLLRLADRAEAEPDRTERVPFGHPDADRDDDGGREPDGPPFNGVVTFTWDRRIPTSSERAMAVLAVEHAVTVVLRQRSEQVADAAIAKVGNLEIALRNSRSVGTAIGILMSLHKLTDTAAFELLRSASQLSNRKVRDLAGDVIATGWLDPASLPSPSGVR